MLKRGNINNILIIRLSSIGDIILTTGVINYLKFKFPNANIYYLTSNNFTELLTNNPNLTNVIPYDKSLNINEQRDFKSKVLKNLGINQFDLILDLHNNNRSRIFRNGIGKLILKVKKNRLRKLLLVNSKPIFNLFYKKKEKNTPFSVVDNYFEPLLQLEKNKLIFEQFKFTLIKNIFEDKFLNNDNFKFISNSIIISPGAKHFTKRLPIQKYVDLCLLILNDNQNDNIIFLGGIEETEICDEIVKKIKESIDDDKIDRIYNYCGSLTLLESFAVISKAKAIVCNDSGIMHLASASKTPIIATFGSTTTNLGFSPLSNSFKIIEVDLDCRPCTHIGRSNCPEGHFNCMNMIDEKVIFNNLKELIRK